MSSAAMPRHSIVWTFTPPGGLNRLCDHERICVMADNNAEKSRPQIALPAATKRPAPIGRKDDIERRWWLLKPYELFTLVLALLVALIYWRQTSIMEAQEAIAQKQEKTAEAQEEIMAVQAKIMVGQTRPWVGLNNITISSIAAGKPLIVSVYIKNSGETPALDVGVCSRFIDVPMNQVTKATIKGIIDSAPPCIYGSNFDVLPNVTKETQAIRPGDQVPQQMADDLNSGKQTVVVFGNTMYTTPAGEHHLTKYCMYYLGNNEVGDCPYGNEAN
jgi:hypothetical protein